MEHREGTTNSGNAVPDITVTHFHKPTVEGCKKKKLQKIASNVPRNERSFLYRTSSCVIKRIEHLCGLWGLVIATHPWRAICISLVLAGLAGCGLYNLRFEFRPYKLWVKEPSEFKEVHEWKMKNFPNSIRKHMAIWEMDNILTAKAINQMWILHQAVDKFRASKGKARYSDVCLKVPSLISSKEVAEKQPSYDDSYDYLQNVEISPRLENNDDTNRDKNNKELDSEISSSKVIPDYEDYPDTYNNKPQSMNGPSWLSVFTNKSVATTLKKPANHYIAKEDTFITERIDHCNFVEELDLICYEESLIEVWGYNDELIKNLTDEQVIEDINNSRSSRVTGYPRNITVLLGGIQRDASGKIIGAQGALQVWYTKVDMNAIKECKKVGSCKIEIDLGSGEEVDAIGMEWEETLTTVVSDLKSRGMPVILQASYQFGAVHRSALFKDFTWVLAGWAVLIVYVFVTLGKPCSVESQVIPSLIGVLCVGLSVLASYGLCTISGIPYGPLNSVLPVLLIAIGVDNMYVIMNSWESCVDSGVRTDVKLRTQKTLHQAGLAITVTSMTDVIAFTVGATTDVPALRYFCVYAAVGITVIYILQVTLFVSAVVLNEKFRNPEKKSCLPSYCSSKYLYSNHDSSLINKCFGQSVKILLKPPVTAFILLVTGIALGGSMCQALQLQQKFESVWLLPKSSDLYRWFKTMDEVFPKNGRDGFIFFENAKLPDELPELQKLSMHLRSNSYISRVDAWFDELQKFISKEEAFRDKPLTTEVFNDALSFFLFNEEGAKYRNDIIFPNGSELICKEPAPPFTTFKINFQYFRLEHSNIAERQNAMKEVRNIVTQAKSSGYKAPWALSYGQWETEVVISVELFRNIAVVLVIIFVVTMILLASFRAALLVLLCVLATLLEVSALMQLWGLTINTVSCIALVLATGICVDYAAHITHGFLVAQGSRKLRAESAMRHMGPAVLHGGVSTMLAFVLLAPSDTFVFLSYFKILTGVAVFGLYNALVLLPILLVLLGPPPYPDTKVSSTSTEDSQSCSTESTSYPYTPSSISPVASRQSTIPNTPSSSTASLHLCHESAANENTENQTKSTAKNELYLSAQRLEAAASKHQEESDRHTTLGPQALQNISLSEAMEHKMNMFVEGSEKEKDIVKDNKKTTVVENTSIKKENILKLYIKNS